jgi:subfamily B ATP-binding cassette protein MsbA
MQNYLRLLSFLKGHKRIFSLAVVAMFLASFFESIQLSLLVPIVDRMFNKKLIILPNQVPDFLTRLVAHLNTLSPERLLQIMPFAILGLLLIKHVVTFYYQYLMNDVSQRVMRDVRHRLYEKIQNLSLDYFSKKRTGELISRITNDVQIIENAVSYGVTDLFRQTFLIIMCVGITLFIYFKAALIIFLVFPLIAWPMAKIGRRLRKFAQRSQERMADINSILLETISGVREVKSFCTEKYEVGRFLAKNQDFYKVRMKSVKWTLWINPITEILGVMGEQLSFGIFILFFGSIMSIISPIKKLGNVNALTQQALSANERIYEILDREPTVKESPSARELGIMKDRIHLENVTFRYDEESGDVLKDINLEIKMGQLVAIVGPTGTGKSTLANLIPRFYDPRLGRVTIDGVDLKDVKFRSLRLQIGIVAQETFLFNDSVKANIAYGCPSATPEEIEQAAEKAYAHQFILRMPQQYNTTIGDRGFRLSGGEKQRIAIARAILKNPPILILDEATSQLDSESEKYVQDALDELMAGRTVIAIAHRLSTIKRADKIVVLEHGRIVGAGKHSDLLTACDLYKRLYETQFQM